MYLPVKRALGDLSPAKLLVGVEECLVALDSSDRQLLLLGAEEPGFLDGVRDPEEGERAGSDRQDTLDDVKVLPAHECTLVNLNQTVGDQSSESTGQSLEN
jgi:hypothetical protein